MRSFAAALTLGLLPLFSSFVLAQTPEPAAGPAFDISAPAEPLKLTLSSPPLSNWGRVPRIRVVYYVTKDQTPDDLDRRTILRELKLIQDFYAHYGLAIEYEDKVYEVLGEAPKDLPVEQYDYYFIKKALERRHLLLPHRTIVFTTFDVGLGGDMALTGLNDANTAKVECPRKEKGSAWWCGRPEAAHWGGSVHEVGHMLGLAHPKDYTAQSPYRYADGRTYVYSDADAVKAVMERHDLFFRHPDNGLLPHEVDALFVKYRDPGAALSAGGSKRP